MTEVLAQKPPWCFYNRKHIDRMAIGVSGTGCTWYLPRQTSAEQFVFLWHIQICEIQRLALGFSGLLQINQWNSTCDLCIPISL